jgi:hypothetical protein
VRVVRGRGGDGDGEVEEGGSLMTMGASALAKTQRDLARYGLVGTCTVRFSACWTGKCSDLLYILYSCTRKTVAPFWLGRVKHSLKPRRHKKKSQHESPVRSHYFLLLFYLSEKDGRTRRLFKSFCLFNSPFSGLPLGG